MEIREIDIDMLCDNCKEEIKPKIINFSKGEIEKWTEYKNQLEKECYIENGYLVLNRAYKVELSRIDTPEKILRLAICVKKHG